MTTEESWEVAEAWAELAEVFRVAPYDMPLRFEKRRAFEAAVRKDERERAVHDHYHHGLVVTRGCRFCAEEDRRRAEPTDRRGLRMPAPVEGGTEG